MLEKSLNFTQICLYEPFLIGVDLCRQYYSIFDFESFWKNSPISIHHCYIFKDTVHLKVVKTEKFNPSVYSIYLS